MKPYPRANISEGDGVALSADLYNRMVDDLERLDRLAVMPPLTLTAGASGATIGMMAPAHELALVAIIGTETGGGKYQGSILLGNSSGDTSTNFQLEACQSQAASDGPAYLQASGVGPINNCLVVNLREPYVNQSHVLFFNAGSPFCAVGRVMGMTAESPPRTIVYINDWPINLVIAKISGIYPPPIGGVYYGKIVQGQFCNNSGFGYSFPLSDLDSSVFPGVDDCWITNEWEQTYGTPSGNALAAGQYVWGLTTGFPLYAPSSSGSMYNTVYQVFTWFPPQSATLTYPPTAITATEIAGTSYTSNEKTMLNALRADVNNLYNTLNNLYTNLKAAGYSK